MLANIHGRLSCGVWYKGFHGGFLEFCVLQGGAPMDRSSSGSRSESGIYMKAWTKGFLAEHHCNPMNDCTHFFCQLFKPETPELEIFLVDIKVKRKYDSKTILVNTFFLFREQGLQCNWQFLMAFIVSLLEATSTLLKWFCSEEVKKDFMLFKAL